MASSDDDVQRGAVIAAGTIMVPALVGGWFLTRKRVFAIVKEREVRDESR
jgi:L-asparagine permease